MMVFSASVCAENLLDVYWLAEKEDPQLRIADADRKATREVDRQSTAQLLPQVDLSASTSTARQEIGGTSTDVDSNGYALSLTQQVYRHETYKLKDKTQAFVMQAEANFEAAQRALMIRVAERYFDVLAAIDNLEFVRSEKEAVGRQLEQTRQRFEVGLIAITDVHEAQAAYDTSVADEITAENDVSSARESLREITGQYHDSLQALADEIPLIQPDPLDAQPWIKRAMEDNFELQAAQAAVDAAREEVNQQRAGHLPYVDLIASHNYTDDAGPNFNSRSTKNTSLMLQLSVPLYRGGATSSRVRESLLRYDQSRDSLEQTRRSVVRQTNNAYLNVLASISRVKALAQALVSTKSALQASEAGLEVGTRTTVDVLNTRRELLRARSNHARARYDYLLSTLRLKEASGMLSIKDFEQINTWLQ
jgi:outer membrane protein